MSERRAGAGAPLLVLVGVSGAGKTTVGRLAARNLGVRFVETDDLVERRAGADVGRLVLRSGPDLPRLQREAGLAVLEPGGVGAGAVVALSASTPTLEGVAAALARARSLGAVVVELVADTADVARREDLNGPHSAALGAPRAMLARMIRSLRAVYAPLADAQVDTRGRDPADVAREAVRAVRRGAQSRMAHGPGRASEREGGQWRRPTT